MAIRQATNRRHAETMKELTQLRERHQLMAKVLDEFSAGEITDLIALARIGKIILEGTDQ